MRMLGDVGIRDGRKVLIKHPFILYTSVDLLIGLFDPEQI